MPRFLALLLLSLGGLAAAEPRPLIIAHRGASGYLPEHTLAAKALAYGQGADFLEQDVVLSKDGVPVIFHDTHIDTTTDVAKKFPGRQRADGRFYALDFSVAELKQLNVTERFNPKTGKAAFPKRFPVGVGSFQVVTLEEEILFIQALNRSTGRNVGLYPELKAPAWHRQEGRDLSATVLPLLRKYGYDAKDSACYLQCFEYAEIKRLRGELGWSGKLIMLLGGKGKGPGETDFTYLQTDAGLAELAQLVDGIGPPISSYVAGKTPAERQVTDLAARSRKAGLKSHPYTLRADELPKCVTSVDELLSALFTEAKVDGLFTDFPDLCIKR
ncbi:MAG: glycerophosphodiester phosphodiesterase [Opitutales bacterium]|jgi:glycerophosphoryl diester phosphodiesterase|nr:glycerophosphodiester phosphodiesterase [Opitutales bacterium]MDP4775043.1 glycerophosphodiester phosphodiesterase [Opitutales bacterium]MDP4787295.1 glycerophosphodiester phosphodiesterase [Opitutales bacterium]MDP4894351.1 glycerophosphodiester phosphodiesterase [Opitutales bacterium]